MRTLAAQMRDHAAETVMPDIPPQVRAHRRQNWKKRPGDAETPLAVRTLASARVPRNRNGRGYGR